MLGHKKHRSELKMADVIILWPPVCINYKGNRKRTILTQFSTTIKLKSNSRNMCHLLKHTDTKSRMDKLTHRRQEVITFTQPDYAGD